MIRASRLIAAAIVAIAIVGGTSMPTRGYTTYGYKWPNGTIVMHMQLGSGSGTLIDGSTSWNQTATNALANWNNYLDLAKFSAVNNSTAADGNPNSVNNVTFGSSYYGKTFGDRTLAITLYWYRGSQMIEGDVTFNTKFSWNSYRGNQRGQTYDIYRVALHEFGHVLGLNHPDEHGQNVSAQMNSTVSNLDALASDDINGARALYGSGVTSNVSFPPRNETNDFNTQLEALYQNRLGAGTTSSYVDAEGANVWLTGYARYRVGLCSHSDATTRVFSQIDNTGVYGVCALTPSGTIPFPPRNEGLDFMNQLDAKYRDGLKRSASTVYVNNEGRVVWVMEYLRYRLNGCNHNDATIRVFQQILGQGIQPVCR